MRARQALSEVPPIAFLVLAAAAYLAPALSHGWALGPYDILATSGLTAHAHATVHNLIASDEIQEFIPWQDLAWTEVHSGHLPLWDPYNLLGMPLAFDFQSAPFSLPVAVSYAFPLPIAHDVVVATRLLVGGTGAYVLGRVLRLSRTSATLAGVVYELSGAFTIWLGAYEAGVLSFLGWILAASVTLSRGGHRARDVTLLAVAVALALYAGEPEIALLVVVAVAVMAAALAAGRWRESGGKGAGWRAAGRCVADHSVAVVAGVGLAAPVYVPGLQLALASARSTGPLVSGLPLYDLSHLLFSSYDGLPTAPRTIVGPDNLYVSMIYVGAIPLALALVALSRSRRNPPVAGVVALTGIVLVALFASPVTDVARLVPDVRVYRLDLATTVADFGLAVLAGVGLDALRGPPGPGARRAYRLLGVATGLLAAALAVLGARLAAGADHLSSAQASQRAGAFAWPAGEVAALVAVLVADRLRRRFEGRRSRPVPVAGPIAVAALVATSTGFLVAAGAGIGSSTSHPFADTPAVAALRRDVGTSLVGIGSCATNSLPAVGVVPNDNVPDRIYELAGFDPIVPRAYTASYAAATGTSDRIGTPPALFCPAVTTAALARRYGVAYVLEPPAAPGPPGTTKVATIAGEGLYAVPRSGRAVVVAPAGSPARSPAATATASASTASGAPLTRVVPAAEPSPSTWRIVVDPPQRSVLRLAVTAVPGWHAGIDGRPLRLRVVDGVLLEATVPAGRHVVTLSYWPVAFTVGLALAGASALALAGACATAGVRRKRGKQDREKMLAVAGLMEALRAPR